MDELSGSHDGAAQGAIDTTAPSGDTHGATEAPVSAGIIGHPVWLRKELDHIARSRSAAAALLEAYERSPDGFLAGIGGHFSLAIVDRRRARALLAVDRFGIGRMFWSRGEDGTLRFGNDPGRLRAARAAEPAYDPQALYDYLYFHFVPSPATVWRGVGKLRPGERLVSDRGGVRVEPYWTPSFEDRGAGFGQLAPELLDTLRAAVAPDHAGDGTAAFLSGGLDSSTICGLLAERTQERAQAFTVSFDHDDYDELQFARIAARHFDLDHHVVEASADAIVDRIDAIFASLDEPFGNSSVVPAYLCAAAAKEAGIDTLLAGDGGDELFAGNARYAKQQLFEKYFLVPAAIRTRVLEPLFCDALARTSFWPVRKARRYIEQACVPLPARLESWNHLEHWPAERVFDADFLATVDTGHPLRLLEERYRQPARADILDRMLYLDWKFTLADNDLRKVTSMCELAGVDVRFPFLDEAVVGLSLRVPSAMKLKGGRLRHFYKRATVGYLPEAILKKPKHGFGLPFGEWLKTSSRLQQCIYDHLRDLGGRGIVNPAFIDDLIEQHRGGHAAFYGEAVWIFSALELWFKHHGRAAAAAPLPVASSRD